MIVRNMRWGYTGDGVACGPVEGSYVVELMVTAEDKHNYFVTCSRFTNDYRVDVTEASTFDLQMEMMDWEVDSNYEIDKLNKLCLETYDGEKENYGPEVGIWDMDEGEEDEEEEEDITSGFQLFEAQEMFASRFAQAIRLVLLAMEECGSMEEPTDADAREFIEKYVGEDISGVVFEMGL